MLQETGPEERIFHLKDGQREVVVGLRNGAGSLTSVLRSNLEEIMFKEIPAGLEFGSLREESFGTEPGRMRGSIKGSMDGCFEKLGVRPVLAVVGGSILARLVRFQLGEERLQMVTTELGVIIAGDHQ